jgi:hypothetical protein
LTGGDGGPGGVLASLWQQLGAALLYNLRHVQHHAAQLNLILRQAVDSAPGWVGRAKI